MELRNGSLLANRYKVVASLGTGAFGPVFLAKDEQRGDGLVALKVFHKGVLSSQKARSRLKESLTVIREQGSGELIKPLQYIHSNELQAVAMEYVAGEDLKSKLEKAELNSSLVCEILRKIAIELHRLHERGVVHNDISPSHILFAENGAIKLAGFPAELGKAVDLALPMSLRVGTAHYKAPEYLKSGVSDQRSDVYSLGILGLELLESCKSDAESDRIAQICKRAASPLADDRHQNAFDFARSLEDEESLTSSKVKLGVRSLSAILVSYSAVVIGLLYALSRSL